MFDDNPEKPALWRSNRSGGKRTHVRVTGGVEGGKAVIGKYIMMVIKKKKFSHSKKKTKNDLSREIQP